MVSISFSLLSVVTTCENNQQIHIIMTTTSFPSNSPLIIQTTVWHQEEEESSETFSVDRMSCYKAVHLFYYVYESHTCRNSACSCRRSTDSFCVVG